jgi:leucyl aminopeptidase
MKTRLNIIKTLTGSGSVAFLPGNSGDMEFPLLPAEMDRWQKRAPKSESLLFQRLPHFLFVVQPDFSKTDNQILESFRKAGASWMETVKKEQIDEISVAGFRDKAYTLAFIEGFLLAGYCFNRYKKEKDDFTPGTINIFHPHITEKELAELDILADAIYWARDLVNEPLSFLTAVELSEQFSRKGDESGFAVEVYHKQKIGTLKMGGLLAVNRGSIDPPTFTVMEWKPDNAVNERPVILIGKGVVYDTGGLSLKPTLKSMDYMKSDMAGAAAVGATLCAASKARLPLHLIGLVPATDNRPDGNALVPGDVITMFDGTTVEVLNTDAEGRLLLADALSYAKKYDPLLVIDIATLTGAASIIAGNHGIIAMGNSGKYLDQLKISGEEVYERIVELPLWEEFRIPLKSEVADLSNIGSREGQTIIAGKFLEHFTGYPWIHLDIASTAWIFEKEGYRTKGGTGSGIRLLFNFLRKF